MKAALAQFIFESNTFNPAAAELDVFESGGTWLTEEAAVRRWCESADSQLGGSLAVLEAAGWEARPVWAAVCGTAAGRLSAGAFRTLRSSLADSLRAALPADALLLHLHGACCAVGEDDVEGNLLAMVREELGFRGRLVLSLDLHANVTRRMLAHSDAVTAYRTMPHMDFRETGERAARLLLDGRPAVRTLAKIPALVASMATHHGYGPFAEILAEARRLEERPGILDVGLYPVQPWMDVPELGMSVVVTSLPGADAAGAARELAEKWYAQREKWRNGLRSWEEILRLLRSGGERPWYLVDSADATAGGASGASAEAVAHLWPHRSDLPGEVLLWVVDETARAAAARGERSLRLGVQQCAVEGEVIFQGEGRFRARGRAYTGQEFSIGQAVVISAGRLRIVVSDRGTLAPDPALYECVGLRPGSALAVQVKSPMTWRAGYGASAEQGLAFDGPGCTSVNFARLPYTGERRLLFPIDPKPAIPVTVWQSDR